eukprot:15235269-Ditylum_brightwellii.AAC.1
MTSDAMQNLVGAGEEPNRRWRRATAKLHTTAIHAMAILALHPFDVTFVHQNISDDSVIECPCVLGKQQFMTDSVLHDHAVHLVNGLLMLDSKWLNLGKWDFWQYLDGERYTISKVNIISHEIDQDILVGQASCRFMVPLFDDLMEVYNLFLAFNGCEWVVDSMGDVVLERSPVRVVREQ